MKRGELLTPGKYTGIPNDILASKNLRPRAKIVYAALLGHLGDNLCVWPSFPCLMAETSLSKQTLVDALADLEQFGLIHVDNSRQHHRSNAYLLYDLVTAAARQAAGNLSTVYSLDGGNGLKSRRQDRNDRLKSRRSQSKVQTVGRSKVQTVTGQGLDGHSLKSRPEPLKEKQKEQRKDEPPQEPPQPQGGRATPGEQDRDDATATTTLAEPLASGTPLLVVAASAAPLASSGPAVARKGPTPASGDSVPPEANGGREKTTTKPAVPRTPSETVKWMYDLAARAGLDMPPDNTEEKRTAIQNLLHAVKERPMLQHMWDQIVQTLSSRKGFSSRNLSWLARRQRGELNTIKYNWQMVAHWIFDDDTTCFNWILDKHWSELCPGAEFYDLNARWDLLEATIGGPVGRYTETKPSPWNRKYIGSEWPHRHGELCRIIKSLGDDHMILFVDYPDEPCQVSAADLIASSDPTPPNTKLREVKRAEEDEDAQIMALLAEDK